MHGVSGLVWAFFRWLQHSISQPKDASCLFALIHTTELARSFITSITFYPIVMSTRASTRGRGSYLSRERGGSQPGTRRQEVVRVPSPTVHPRYADKDNSGTDLVIQTSDDVIFKVHSFDLQAAR